MWEIVFQLYLQKQRWFWWPFLRHSDRPFEAGGTSFEESQTLISLPSIMLSEHRILLLAQVFGIKLKTLTNLATGPTTSILKHDWIVKLTMPWEFRATTALFKLEQKIIGRLFLWYVIGYPWLNLFTAAHEARSTHVPKNLIKRGERDHLS